MDCGAFGWTMSVSVCEVERSNMIDANGFARVHLNHYVLVPSKAHSILWACILSPLGPLPFIFYGETRPIWLFESRVFCYLYFNPFHLNINVYPTKHNHICYASR